jgi:hypothetical protein
MSETHTGVIVQAKATRLTDRREAHGNDAFKMAGLNAVDAPISPTTRKLGDIHRMIARALDRDNADK